MASDRGMSRRRFLKGSTAAAGAGLASVVLPDIVIAQTEAERASAPADAVVLDSWDAYCQKNMWDKVLETVHLARDGLADIEPGRITRDGKRITVNLTYKGEPIHFSTTMDQYLDDVARGFMSNDIDTEMAAKRPKLLARGFENSSGIDLLMHRLGKHLPHDPRYLNQKISLANDVIDFLVENTGYLHDDPVHRQSGSTDGIKGTPYNKPFDGVDFDYFKSTPQFLIEGKGDCDDYATAAATILSKLEVPTYFVSFSYPNVREDSQEAVQAGLLDRKAHAVIGMEVTQNQAEQLQDDAQRLKLVAEQLYRAREQYIGRGQTVAFKDVVLPPTMDIRAKKKDASGERWVNLHILEPQSQLAWKSHWPFDYQDSLAGVMDTATRVQAIIDPSTGERLTDAEVTHRGRETLHRVSVRDGGIVEIIRSQGDAPSTYTF